MSARTTSRKRDLWLRLENYHFEDLVPPHLADRVAAAFGGADASMKAFANKIATKLGWTPRFALRTIDEYRRFVYLGLVSDFYVTPPRAIDQVWHEHLLFTSAYRAFCREVLRQDFDHHPELLPTPDQTGVFEAQYEATLDLYEREFNRAPPVDIWGTPKFSRDAAAKGRTPKSKSDGNDWGDTPLYMMMTDSGGSDGWSGNGHHHEHGHHGHADSGGHAGHGHGGEGGSDAGASSCGSSCGTGSGCSSGCGGGGCGGGCGGG
jgi:hypothetical protein